MKVSLAAQAVAKEVSAMIGAGEKPIVEKIALKHGYSKTSARAGLVQKTKSYQEVIAKVNEKAAANFARERDRAFQAMAEKIKDARYRDVAYAVDVFTKNHALLTGQATENVAMKGAIVMLPSSEDKPQHDTKVDNSVK